MVASNIYFNGKHTAVGGLRWMHSDHLGTPRMKVDNNAQVVSRDWYYPFGEQINIPADNIQYKFTGKERDGESGLDNFDFRYYSSSLGRFMKPDEPFAGWDQHDPQSFNLYSYVQNNPLNWIDPDGHDMQVCVVGEKEGTQKCFNLTDEQYGKLYEAQQGQQGISLPGGNLPSGEITCGGQVCGTVQYFEPGLESHDTVNFAIGGLFKGGIGLLEGLFGRQAARAGGVVIGKMQDLKPGSLKPGERTLDMPNLGSPKANWPQNSSRLRQAMAQGKPIRDASVDAAGNRVRNTGFLRAERNLLENHGWKFKGGYWYPPNK